MHNDNHSNLSISWWKGSVVSPVTNLIKQLSLINTDLFWLRSNKRFFCGFTTTLIFSYRKYNFLMKLRQILDSYFTNQVRGAGSIELRAEPELWEWKLRLFHYYIMMLCRSGSKQTCRVSALQTDRSPLSPDTSMNSQLQFHVNAIRATSLFI